MNAEREGINRRIDTARGGEGGDPGIRKCGENRSAVPNRRAIRRFLTEALKKQAESAAAKKKGREAGENRRFSGVSRDRTRGGGAGSLYAAK